MEARVDIQDGGRAGSISYHESRHTASFDWEFASPPALAFISGPKAAEWDHACPWASGRQAEIFERVAQEVIRQKAPGCRFELDLRGGVITIFQREDAHPPARKGKKGKRSSDPLAELPEADVEELIELLLLEGMTGPAVDGLAQIPHPRAHALVAEAFQDRLSVDVRLAAAEALHARGELPELEPILVREIRALHQPTDGLRRALRLAETHPTPAIKQALLWASWNATDCAPECARLLLKLVRGRDVPEAALAVLPRLGLHNSYFERKAAFDVLCQTVGMTVSEG